MTAWSTADVNAFGETLRYEETEGLVWSDFAIDTIHNAGKALSVLIEQVVSVHILEMRSTSTQESLRALRELRSEFLIGPVMHFFPAELREPQTVYRYALAPQFPRPVFVSTLSSYIDVSPTPAVSALARFLGPLASELEGEPEETWRHKALAHFGGSTEKSPWADAIGLLYSSEGMAAALDISATQLSQAVESRLLLALPSSDDEPLFPVAQVRRDGRLVRGLQWILSQLDDKRIDRYTVAAWLNQKHEDLDDASVWEALGESDTLPDAVKRLVLDFRTSISR